jgi:nicotinate-nucleotide adenylyltransferase
VLLVPAAVPPHKIGRDLAPAADREAMLRLAIAGMDGLEVSTIELDDGRVCYTIDTLRRLRVGPPAIAPVFILGMDSLVELGTWKNHRDLLREFDLIVVDRPGLPPRLPEEIGRALVDLEGGRGTATGASEPGRGGRIFRLRLPPIPISSSEVRERAAAGGNLADLVPDAVAGYIRSRGLYGHGVLEEGH